MWRYPTNNNFAMEFGVSFLPSIQGRWIRYQKVGEIYEYIDMRRLHFWFSGWQKQCSQALCLKAKLFTLDVGSGFTVGMLYAFKPGSGFCLSLVPSGPMRVSARTDRLNSVHLESYASESPVPDSPINS